MFGCFRHILPAAIGFFGVVAAWAGAGYLPQVGPVPLRFRALPPPPTRQITEPLPPPAPPPAPVPAVSPKLPALTAPVVVPVPVTNAPAVEYNARDFGAVAVPVPPDAMVSPQMLIKYFTLSTNGTGMSAVAPVGFTPPTVAVPGTPPPPGRPAPSTPP
jgi:hypothetical protein